jgi:glycosyltransferase involved in cell wall biosynthesis
MRNLTHGLTSLERVQMSENRSSPAGRWIEVVPHLDPKYGGLSAVVPQLGSKLATQEHLSINLAGFCSPDELDTLKHYPAISLTHWPLSRTAWFRRSDLDERFRELVSKADGVHIHGLWEGCTAVAGRAARSLDKPYIISAHGMLDPWALANKGLKKRIYSALVERANIESAACLHALTKAEAEDYRRYGSRRPIAVVPNGVDLPRSVDARLFLEEFPELEGKRMVLFLGRIHFKKGLDILAQAWGNLAKRFPDAVLVLAGPDSENSRAAVEELITIYGISDRVFFTGMLAEKVKWSALATAHCFVLPSYSEGLSVATLEAMGMGLPVIITEQCHLPEVSQFEAGWEIRADVTSLYSALEEMLENSPATNSEIGERGRRIVQKRYSWPVVARQMAELYRWVQGGPVPHSVELLEVSA